MHVSHNKLFRATAACLALTTPVLLVACGGGGGGGNGTVAQTPPPPSSPVPPPPPPPSTPPPSTTAYTYPADNQLGPTGVGAVQADGITGAGVKVGVMDTGVDPNDPALKGKIAWFASYDSNGNLLPSVTTNDNYGHGSNIADMIAGSAVTETSSTGVINSFAGGVAPGASLYVAQVCGTDGKTCNTYPAAIKALAAQNVVVINESYGAGDITTVSPQDGASMLPWMSLAAQYGILQVAAAGNDGTPDPGYPAGMPYFDPSLQPFMIAAVNVDLNNAGDVTRLAVAQAGGEPASAACGVAAEWCLAAPGSSQGIPHLPGFPTGLADGTSNSTAIITGVAALVSQVYPWMNGANLQQTLLTTATNLTTDASGNVVATYVQGTAYVPNATFGWGLVNATRAVNGPGQFIRAFNANLGNDTSTFSNSISGTGSLVVSGAGNGELDLNGGDTYTGGTTINAGVRVNVNGSIASDVTLNGGALGGTGVINANVNNIAGIVASQQTANGVGLTIGGTLTSGPNSATWVELGSPLVVGETAQVAGTMNVVGVSTGYTVKATEPLVEAGAIQGTYATLTFAPGTFYTGTLAYTATQVDVDLTQVAPTTAAASMPRATAQTVAAAGNLQTALKVSNQWFEHGDTAGHVDWFNAAGKLLAAPTADVAVASLDSVSGEIYATSRAVEAAQALDADRAIADRQDDLANGATRGVWVQAAGASGAFARTGYDPTHYQFGGTMAGIDAPLGDGFSGGLVIGRTRGASSLDGMGGRIDTREDFGMAYGRYAAGAGWYAAARAGFAHFTNGVQRSVMPGFDPSALVGSRTDRVVTATLEVGRGLTAGAWTLTPYVSETYLGIHQGSFAEQGSTMGLAAAAQTHTVTLGNAGLRFGRAFQWAGGDSYLSGYAAYRRALVGADLGMAAHYVGVADATFTVEGQNLPRNLGMVGLGLNTRVNGTWSWFVNAGYMAGGSGVHAVSANAGIKLSF